eukprot:158696_1
MLYFMVMGIRNYCNGSNANNGNKKFLESMSEINSRINGDESKNENGTRIELQSIEEGKQKLDHEIENLMEYMDDMSKIKTENGTIIELDESKNENLMEYMDDMSKIKTENGTIIELDESKNENLMEYMDDMSKIKTENGTIIVLDDNDGTDLILRENKIDPTKEV